MIDRLGWTLLHFLWQGVAVAFVLYLLLLLCGRVRAVVRYLIAVGAMVVMVAVVVVTFFVVGERVATPQSVVESGFRERGPTVLPHGAPEVQVGVVESLPDGRGSDAVAARLQPLMPVFVGGWLLGVLLLALYHLGGFVAAQRLKTLRTSLPSVAVESLLGGLVQRMRLSRPVKLLASTLVQTPMVLGYFRPVILVPASILSGLSPQELQAILAHELAHIRRHDYVVNLLQAIVETVLFYHPAIWWVSQQIRREREHCCDDVATAICGDRLIYVQALASLEELRPAPSLALAATSSPLMERVRRLLNVPVPRSSSRFSLIAVVVIIVLSAMFLMPTACNQKRDNVEKLQADYETRISEYEMQLHTLDATIAAFEVELAAQKTKNHSALVIAGWESELKVMHATRTLVEAEKEQLKRQAAMGRPLSHSLNVLRHDVPFQIDGPRFAHKEFAAGDNITITAIRGTWSKLEPGNTYRISGTYTLASRDHATLAVFVTADEDTLTLGRSEPYDPQQQTLSIKKGTGTFTLLLPFKSKGHPHVSFYSSDGSSFGGVYFSSPATKMEKASKLMESGDYHAAADAYREILKDDPNNEVAELLLRLATRRIERAYQPATSQPAAPQPKAETVPQASGTDKDIHAKVEKLKFGVSQWADVVAVMGKPDKYMWGDEEKRTSQEFTEDKLPNTYTMMYPGSFRIVIVDGKLWEIRFEGEVAAYRFKDKLRVGSTLDEVLQVLAPPTETVVGEKPQSDEGGVLYKDIGGRAGYCYYARPDQGIRLFFAGNKVSALYLTATVTPSEAGAVPQASGRDKDIVAKVEQIKIGKATREDVLRVFGVPNAYHGNGSKTYTVEELPS
ncbi:MAG: M48 family metalloprotease, partial [Phycisphaerales bacterium]|nr:M48 family metalloprotease [Phycisphaerales bacterium]